MATNQGKVQMNFQITAVDRFKKLTLTDDLVRANQARLTAAQDKAFSKSGPNKGHLKAKCPAMGTDAAILWQAIQMVTNPYRVSIAQLIFLDADQQAFFELVEALTTEAVNRKRRKIA
tara:strand:- start:1517 stop:1870 length:354 start_codon:yes stop_codon:yes gene_type:complete